MVSSSLVVWLVVHLSCVVVRSCEVSRLSPEKRAAVASIVVKALVTNIWREGAEQETTAEIWIIDVYKGEKIY